MSDDFIEGLTGELHGIRWNQIGGAMPELQVLLRGEQNPNEYIWVSVPLVHSFQQIITPDPSDG